MSVNWLVINMITHVADVWIDCVLLIYGQYTLGMNAVKTLNLCHDGRLAELSSYLFIGKMRSGCSGPS